MRVSSRRRRGLRVEYRVLRAAVLLVLLLGATKLWGPLATDRRQQDELTKLHLEKATLLAEHNRLQEYKRKLASDTGFEAAARRLGYLRDGERRLVFIPRSEQKPSSPAPADKEKDPKKPSH
jgi:hypothetical protein